MPVNTFPRQLELAAEKEKALYLVVDADRWEVHGYFDEIYEAQRFAAEQALELIGPLAVLQTRSTYERPSASSLPF